MNSDDTPLMQQWRDAKSRHRDALLFFRVGDFYELFHSDAEEGARLLGLTLTSRNNGAAARVPLAGVPAKALDEYLARLVKLGRRVAICDQVEDPALAKGIVRREVTETVTPGTVVADALLSERRNNYVVALAPEGDRGWGMAALDVSTGEMSARMVPGAELVAELGRLEASELLLPRSLEDAQVVGSVEGPVRTHRDDWMFEADVCADALRSTYGIQSLDGFGFEPADTALVRAAGALVQYLAEIRPAGVGHLRPVRILRPGHVMLLDEMTRRNLELVEALRPGEEGGTLLAVLDETVTAMGARLLRRWILEPLVVPEEIWRRQDAVRELHERAELRGALGEALKGVTDLERLAGKLGTGRVAPRDLLGLRRSLERLPAVRKAGGDVEAELLRELAADVDCLEDVADLLDRAIAEDPPATLQEGGVIRPGWSAELDELRDVRDGAVDFIARLQARERGAHGHRVAQGRLQQGVRLLPGGDAGEPGSGAGRFRAQADADQRRALLHARAQGMGGEGVRRGGPHRAARGRAVRAGACAPGRRRWRGSRRRGGDWPRWTCLPRSPMSPSAAATSARRCTPASSSRSARVVIRWWRR